MDEVALLTWAAGSERPLTQEPKYDESRLLQAVLRHKLTRRLLSRIEREVPSWPSLHLLDELRHQQSAIEQEFSWRLDELRSIATYNSGSRPIAVLKGPTSYFLTGSADTIRFSNDIDLLPPDPAALRTTLLHHGYQDSDDFCRSHEYASLYRSGRNVDIHSFFPVVGAPLLAKDNLRPTANPGVWRGLGALPEYQITYSLLSQHSFAPAGYEGLICANSSLAALIICVHLFREYCHTAIPLPYATIRLGELSEIRDLTMSTDFDPELFGALADHCAAGMSVDFVASLLYTLLGSEILGRGGKYTAFPYDLWLSGFAIADGRFDSKERLIVREPTYRAGDAMEAIGTCEIDAVTEGDPIVYSTHEDGSTRSLNRILVHGDTLCFTLSCRWRPTSLDLEFHIDGYPRGCEVFFISLGDILYEVALSAPKRTLTTRRRRNTTRQKSVSGNVKWKASVPGTVTARTDSHVVTLSFDWVDLLASSPDINELHAFIGLRRESGSHGEGITAGCLIPARIVKKVPSEGQSR